MYDIFLLASGFGIRCYTGQKYAEFPGLQQTPIKSVECGANENACFTANVTMVLPKTSFIASAIYGICINDTVDPCESYCDKIRQLSPLTSCRVSKFFFFLHLYPCLTSFIHKFINSLSL